MIHIENYTCLGQNISFQNGVDKEIQIMKEKSLKRFWALGKIFKGNMSVQAKTKILNMCVIPVLTYGAQTWALIKVQQEKIRSTNVWGTLKKFRVSP